MGQYYKAVNIDKHQFLHAHSYGDGLKLMEFGSSSHGVMSALASLITLTKDCRGSWAGDHIVIAGDYADEGNFVPSSAKALNLYHLAAQLDSDDIAKLGGPEVVLTLPKYEKIEPDDRPEFQWLKTVANVQLRERSEEKSKDHALSDASQVFDQPEDIFEAINYFYSEDPDDCFGSLQTFLRMSEIPSRIAWQHSYACSVKVDSKTGRVVTWTCVARSKESNQKTRTSLNFPATASEVLAFLAPA